jgi:hypothetical protein
MAFQSRFETDNLLLSIFQNAILFVVYFSIGVLMKTYMCIILAAVGLSSPVPAQTDYQWVDPAGGSYADPNNWLPEGIPGPADLASFGLSATYPILFDTDWTLGRLMVDNGEIDLDLGSRRLDLVWAEPTDNAAVVGHISGGKLLLTNGSVYSGSVNLGRNPGAFGALQVSSGGFWEARRDPDWHGIWIGFNGNADMTVDSGGIVRHGHGEAAVMPGSTARISVVGGSTWYVDGWFGTGVAGDATVTSDFGLIDIGRTELAVEEGSRVRMTLVHYSMMQLRAFWETSLTIGQRGSALLSVTNGSILTNYGDLSIAAYPGSSGTLLVLNMATVASQGSMVVGGMAEDNGGIGIVRVENASNLWVGTGAGSTIKIRPNGKVHLDRNCLLKMLDDNSQTLGTILIEGRFDGSGIVQADIVQSSGILAPAYDIPEMTQMELTGNYIQEGGDFQVQIRGIDGLHSKLFDQTGSATLNGNLKVQLADGFVPKDTDSFTILEFPGAGISGAFANAASMISFDEGTFDVVYTGTSVVLTNFRSDSFCPEKPLGDLNEDCRVDMLDLSLMAQNWLRCNLVPADLCQPQ